MTKTLIRHATSQDFPALLEIDEASFPVGVAYSSNELAYFMNRPAAETLVLERDGSVAAFLIMDVKRRRKHATIITLDVRQDYRRHGYASRLIQRSQEILIGYGVETYDLQVDLENHGAIKFYEKHGFERADVLRNYYSNGHDAFLMTKKLHASDGK